MQKLNTIKKKVGNRMIPTGRSLLSVVLVSLITSSLFAQIPPGYYEEATGLYGTDLQQALHDIIDGHSGVNYTQLWGLFEETDQKPNGYVWDIYSDIPGGTPPYQYIFFSDQCGNYSQEGDCYNREHSFPKSWFGGTVYPMYSDLFHIYPTDGYVNSQRGNYPYGDVGNASWTSLNGSKVGNNSSTGYSGTVFEPIDAYKGDLARTYFYMATRYFEEDGNWPGSPMVDGAQPKPWALELLRQWHLDDPVSTKEIDRNNAVFEIQENRNPFIDHPEYVDMIWFYTAIVEPNKGLRTSISVYPNPVSERLTIELKKVPDPNDMQITVSDIAGSLLKIRMTESGDHRYISTNSWSRGLYFLILKNTTTGETASFKIMKH